MKDNIDMKGVVTSAGSEYILEHNPPAARDADCLAIARTRNVRIVGKTNLSEFAVAPSGLNDYFRTPKNPLSNRRKLIPGGSSSGSAVAVANGSADVAFGTDTAGSVRVPAACCGVVGLKTTFGLISTKGLFPVEAASGYRRADRQRRGSRCARNGSLAKRICRTISNGRRRQTYRQEDQNWTTLPERHRP